MREVRWRPLRLLAGAAVIGFAVWAVAQSLDDLRANPIPWTFRPAWIAAAAGVTWLMYALLVAAWRGLLLGWGEAVGWSTAARIWTVSSLGKYVPGKIWAVAGMAAMAKDAGVSPWAATAAAVLNQVLSIAAGVGVAALLGLEALDRAGAGTRATLLLAGLASVALTGLLCWEPFVRRLLRVAKVETAFRTPRLEELGGALAANVTAWLGYGVGLWCLARGVLGPDALPLAVAIAVFAASYVSGLLALVAPGGAGVREGAMILLLQGAVGAPTALALALASRVLLTCTELGAAVPFLLLKPEKSRVAS